MKHFRLLLTLFALMLGWTNVSAQSWTASEVETGNFYLYNVGKGQFLTSGNSYGTQASVSANSALTVIVEEYNGAYKLRNNVNGDGNGFERLGDPVIYADQSRGKNSTWTFTKVDDASNGPVYTIVSAENHNGGAGSYMTANADNTIVGPADEVTDDYGRWQLVQSWITNSVPVINTNGWTVSQTPTNFDGGNVCAEFWNAAGASIKQTVNNLPAGSFELIAVALTRDGMTATLNAGTNTMSIATVSSTVVNGRGAANTWFNAGNGVNRLEFTHAGGNLEIGLTADNTTGDHWLVWRSFVLIYKGVDLSELKAALQALIDAVPALEGTTTAAAYNAAKNYADGIDMDALTTEEAISAASTELANLVNAAKALQAPYNRYKALKAAVDALDDDTSAFTGEATVNTTDADGAVEAATSLGDIEYAITLLRADAVTFLNAIVVNEGKSIDITDIWAVNPGFEEGNTNGWTNSGSIEANAQGNKVFDNTQGNYYAERWHTDGTVNLSQTITGLPAGSYVISAYLYTDTPDGVLFANESKTSFNTSNNYSVNVEVDDNGSINFGASCTLTTSTWICMDDFKIALAGVDHSRYNSVKEAVLAIANDLDITQAEALNASAKKTEDIENAVKALRTALLTYLPEAEIPEVGYIDLTNALIDNPTVRQNTDYWTAEGTPNTSYSWGVVNYEECEFYYQNFDFYQTLNLCKGTFEFGVTGFHRAGNHATYFYAGEDKVLIPGVESSVVNSMDAAKTYFDAGNGKVALKFALEGESNNIKIGIVNNDTETDRWTIFRDFTLKYFGATIDLTPYKEALAAAVAKVSALEETIPTAAYNQLTSNVGEQNKEYDSVEDYQTATAAVENLIAEAKKLQAPYAAYLTLESEVQALYEVADYEEITEGSHDTLGTALSTAKTNIATATTIEDVNTIAGALRAAGATYAGAANPTGEAKFNLTFMLTNPDVSSFPSRTDRADIPGWYTDQTDGNSQTMTNDAATSEDGTKTHFFEYWSNPAKANNEFALYQKVTLPPGTFDISCYAFAQDQYAGQNSVGVYFYANDTQGSSVSTARLTEASLSFINDAEQEVKIGLKTLTGNTYNWMGIGYMQLYKVPANTTEYMINTDGIENAAVVATIDGVEVSKALALKNVTLTVSANDGYIVESVTVTYTEGGEIKSVDVANTAEGVYTFQMPAFDVTVNVTTAKLATDAELTALAQALQPTAKLGFDEGDYAPYNNVENLTTAEAEIAKVYAEKETYGNATQATVVAATQVISQLNWVANTEEVNAVYDGNFALAQVVETSTDDEITKGWSNPTGIRQIIGTIENFPGLADASAGKAAFSWNGTYNYGEAQGYTMPLKAKTTYKFSIKYTGWSGQNLNNGADVYIYNPDGTTLATEAMGVVENNIANENSLKSYTLEFTTGEAGNYVLGLNPKGNWVFTDVSIFKAKTKKGDVNGDGNVNVADVTALVNAIAKGEQPAAGNLDGVEGVDANDVKALVELVLKEE